MSQIDRKARIREYKENLPPAGIFRIRNTVTGMSLIRPSLNLPGGLNSQRFQLETGAHPDRDLQADWDRLGPEAFVFEVLDELSRKDQDEADLRHEVHLLHRMWLEKLPSDSLYAFSRRGAGPAPSADGVTR